MRSSPTNRVKIIAVDIVYIVYYPQFVAFWRTRDYNLGGDVIHSESLGINDMYHIYT